MTVYTNITKPSGTSYTNVSGGTYVFDSASTSYDDPVIQYDGGSGVYTNLTKPNGITAFKYGITQGLLIPLTYSTSVLSDGYTRINKPT